MNISELRNLIINDIKNVINPGGVDNRTEGIILEEILNIVNSFISEQGGFFQGFIEAGAEAPDSTLKGNIAYISTQSKPGIYDYSNYGFPALELKEASIILFSRIFDNWDYKSIPIAVAVNITQNFGNSENSVISQAAITTAFKNLRESFENLYLEKDAAEEEYLSKNKSEETVSGLINFIKGIIVSGGINADEIETPVLSTQEIRNSSKIKSKLLEVLEKLTAKIIEAENIDVSDTISAFEAVVRDLKADNGNVKNLVFNSLKQEGFTEGILGNGTGLSSDGKTLYVPNLIVKESATFVELLIQKLRAQGGQSVLSGAAHEITNIETYPTYWKIYITGNNEFTVGSLPRIQNFSGDNIGYLWAECIAVGTDYIHLSRENKNGDYIPKEGDQMVQFGHKTDKSKQNIVLLSAVNNQVGLFTYLGVNSFSLTGKAGPWIGQNGDQVGIEVIVEGKTIQSYTKEITDNAVNNIVLSSENVLLNSSSYAASNGNISFKQADMINIIPLINENAEVILSADFDITYNSENATGFVQILFRINYDDGTGENFWIYKAKTNIKDRLYSVYKRPTSKTAISISYGIIEITGGHTGKVSKVKIAAGNKDTGYSIATSDIDNKILEVKTSAINAQNSAETANNAIGNLSGYVDGALKDDIIDESERNAIAQQINHVNSTWCDFESSYNVVYTNIYLSGNPKTTLLNSKISLAGYKDDLLNAITSLTSAQKITTSLRNAYKTAYNNYNNSVATFKTALENANTAIQNAIKSASDLYVDSSITNIEIGGVNLLNGTANPCKRLSSETTNNTQVQYQWDQELLEILQSHQEFTLSADFDVTKVTEDFTSYIEIYYKYKTATSDKETQVGFGISKNETFKGKVSQSFSVPADRIVTSIAYTSATVGRWNKPSNGYGIIKNFQIEKGNKDTQWRPSNADTVMKTDFDAYSQMTQEKFEQVYSRTDWLENRVILPILIDSSKEKNNYKLSGSSGNTLAQMLSENSGSMLYNNLIYVGGKSFTISVINSSNVSRIYAYRYDSNGKFTGTISNTSSSSLITNTAKAEYIAIYVDKKSGITPDLTKDIEVLTYYSENTVASAITQKSNEIELKVLNTGINIKEKKIILKSDNTIFSNSDGSITGKVSIDATTGTLNAVDGNFSGVINANSYIQATETYILYLENGVQKCKKDGVIMPSSTFANNYCFLSPSVLNIVIIDTRKGYRDPVCISPDSINSQDGATISITSITLSDESCGIFFGERNGNSTNFKSVVMGALYDNYIYGKPNNGIFGSSSSIFFFTNINAIESFTFNNLDCIKDLNTDSIFEEIRNVKSSGWILSKYNIFRPDETFLNSMISKYHN